MPRRRCGARPTSRRRGYLETLHYKRASDREHHREGLLKAGLPA